MRPTWAEVNLGNIAWNVRQLKSISRAPHFMAVVKADGYGHGAAQVAKTALANGADWLGVAVLDEGVALRRAGVSAPILVLGYTPPSQAGLLVEFDLTATLLHLDLAQALGRQAEAEGRTARVHLKVDTGMGRLGAPPDRSGVELAQRVAAVPGVELEGVFTHFASADEADTAYTGEQIRRFTSFCDALRAAGVAVRLRHAANTAGLLAHPESHFDLVRPGIGLYGYYPSSEVARPVKLRPAMTWKTTISFLKEVEPGAALSYGRTYQAAGRELIATLPVGYADGFSRAWSNRGQVLAGGVRCPVVGRVCMDQIMVRLPPGHPARLRDEVVLMGRQGGEEITADDLAAGLGTISYEVLCLVGKRVPRAYAG